MGKRSWIPLISSVILFIFIVSIAILNGKSVWLFLLALGIITPSRLKFLISLMNHASSQHQKISENKILPQGTITLGRYQKVARAMIKFDYEELERATSNFSSGIGRGGSSCVFEGILQDGTRVAVKQMLRKEHQQHQQPRVNPNSMGVLGGQDVRNLQEAEFPTEISVTGCVQHMNVVQLHGYCIVPRRPHFLVYELMENGSLDEWIFPSKDVKTRPRGCLPWNVRYKVAIDVARALSFLHNDCQPTILHLDIKPQNVLLDENFQARLSDFGMARWIEDGRKSVIFRTVCGTKEYLAPEWILDDKVSPNSDVYSYGMLLLEMIGGQRNIVYTPYEVKKWEYYPKIVYEKLKAGDIMEVVDKRLVEDGIISENEVKKMVCIALWCIQEKVNLRPNMAEVVNFLEGQVPVDEPPETEMFFYDLLLAKQKKWSDLEQIKC